VAHSRIHCLWLICIWIFPVLATTSGARAQQPEQTPGGSFALMMLQAAASASPQGNVAVSPLSLGAALAVAGHAANGRTAEQFDQLLGLPVHLHPQDAAARLRAVTDDLAGAVIVRNALWVPVALPLSPDFSMAPFDGALRTMPAGPPGAAATINAWAAEATHGAITDLVDASIDTRAFLVTNATYFKGIWLTRFNPDETRERDFYARGETPHPVPMMRHVDFGALYWQSGDLEAVRLPLEGGVLDYVIVTSRSRGSGDEILKEIAQGGYLEGLCRGAGFERRRGVVEIPRHRVDFSTDLRDSLVRMGLRDPFAPGANFSRLSDAQLSLSAVRHRSVITVDETGAEAAAATAAIMSRSGAAVPEGPLDFAADRPFLGILVDSGTSGWPLMLTMVRSL
jgi:serine protease inhibitor